MFGSEVFCKEVKILKTIPYNLIEVVSSYMCDFDLKCLHGRNANTCPAVNKKQVMHYYCYSILCTVLKMVVQANKYMIVYLSQD